MFVVSGPGRAHEQASDGASINSLLAAVAGKSWKKTASSTLKGQRYPYYYGIHPTGRYHDWPPIKELYYDGATTQILLSGARPVPVPEPPRLPPVIDGPGSLTHLR